MGKISEIFNFDNIGSKIKNLAKWSCWITILLIWIAAPITFIVLVTDDRTAYLCWIPLVSAIVGPVFVWIGSWAMYAFGESVENIQALKNQASMIYNINKNLQIIAQPTIDETKEKNKCEKEERAKHKADPPPAKTENTFTEGSWVCGKCKTKNLNLRNDCWSCGNPK